MELYTVKSGQNIYDVALALYGSVEGIFDLLVSNTTSVGGGPLSMASKLEPGTVLKYHTEFMINSDIVDWMKDHDIDVKNGEGDFLFCTPLNAMIRHYYMYHKTSYDSITTSKTVEQQVTTWKAMTRPRMVIKQQGNYSAIGATLYSNCHMMIDWGDSTSLDIVEGDTSTDIEKEHQYDDSGSHTIILYGDFSCVELDFSHINGVHYCVDSVVIGNFIDTMHNTVLNTLIKKS